MLSQPVGARQVHFVPENLEEDFAPWYERARLTGYLANMRESLRILYDEEDLSAENVERVSRKVREH